MTHDVPVSFSPAQHLSRINGSDYLEVKWRLVWLRDRHPDAAIETELISHVADTALFRARISVPGGGMATGWGSEAANDFRDYLEKAETKAIGRALAALGFGSQFCADHEIGAAGSTPVGDEHDPAPPGQLRYLQELARKAGFDEDGLDGLAMREFEVMTASLSKREANALAELIRSRTKGVRPQLAAVGEGQHIGRRQA